MVLKLFSLRRLCKSLLDLRRTSNKMLIKRHIIKVLLMKHKKKCSSFIVIFLLNMFLQRSSNLEIICENGTAIYLSKFIRV